MRIGCGRYHVHPFTVLHVHVRNIRMTCLMHGDVVLGGGCGLLAACGRGGSCGSGPRAGMCPPPTAGACPAALLLTAPLVLLPQKQPRKSGVIALLPFFHANLHGDISPVIACTWRFTRRLPESIRRMTVSCKGQ